MTALSVVIPNYNRAALIGETLENVLGQSRAPDEVIVVDDGSTDESVAEIERFAPRVTLIRQANAGPGAARNRGLAAARGELIQFMDSDDLWSRNKLAAQERALLASEADFAYSPWLQARLEHGVARHADPVLQQAAPPPARSLTGWFLRGWVIVFQCCLFRRSLLDAVGPYRTDLMPTEDSELFFRMLASGARGVHVPEALTLYRLHGGGQISQGGMAAEKRARDWDRYTQVIEARLAALPGLSAADRTAWALARREATTALGAFAPDVARPSAARTALDRINAMASRALRKARGETWPPAYRAGPPTARQIELIGELGYRVERTASVL